MVDGETFLYSENFACPEHGVSLPELEPRIFSFNAPHGACPRCTGLGSQLEIDPDLLVPDPSLSIDEGALVPWSLGGQGFYEAAIKAVADRYEIDLHTPWRDLDREQQDRFLHGTGGDRILVTYRNRMGRKRQYTMAFEGLVSQACSAGIARPTRRSSASASRSTCRCGRARSATAPGSSPRCSPSRSAAGRSTRSRSSRSPRRSGSSTSWS